jgi:hypothetical protein
MLGMQELVDVAGVEVIGTNRLRLPFADATVGQVDFGEWPLPVLISRSFAAGDTFVTSTPPWGWRRGGALATGCGSLRTRFAGEQRLLDVLEVLADGLAHAA